MKATCYRARLEPFSREVIVVAYSLTEAIDIINQTTKSTGIKSIEVDYDIQVIISKELAKELTGETLNEQGN